MADEKNEKATEAPAEAQKAAEDVSSESASQDLQEVTLEKGRVGLLGLKAGMTHVYEDSGQMVPVTVIEVRPNVVTQVRTQEKDGYAALQVGFLEKAKKNWKKSEVGHAKKSDGQVKVVHQEFRMEKAAELEGVQAGQVLSLGAFKAGDVIDVTAVSKGKGFQGVMKRHHFAGGPASHGASITHRMPGSISSNRGTGLILKGKRMAGQMGNKKVTTQNLTVVRVDAEKNLLLVKGSVPGPRSGVVTLRRAIKSL